MTTTAQHHTTGPTPPARRAWQAPELNELRADGTELGVGPGTDTTTSS